VRSFVRFIIVLVAAVLVMGTCTRTPLSVDVIGRSYPATRFWYTFNHGVTLSVLFATPPGFEQSEVPGVSGWKAPGSQYLVPMDFVDENGEGIKGNWVLEFLGVDGGDAFDITVHVTVN
jgi:hypothetical protein